MSTEGNRGRATKSDGGDRAAATTPGSRAVIRTADSMPGDSMRMGAADTHVAAAVSATELNPVVDVRATSGPAVVTTGGAADLGDDSLADTRAAGDNRATRHDRADDEPLLGAILLDRYQITGKIGQGGMGAVYEALHTKIGKRVAIKVLLAKYLDRDQIVARLEQEARLASSIGHEHIIDITDFGETGDGRTFVVMEFLDGESLGARIQRDGPMDEQRAVRIAQQIASALHAAHEKGIIHRDIKPENVFLLRRKNEDFVKVVDFGISKSLSPEDNGGDSSPRLTQTGMVLGTPLYMSPEQARGSEVLDRRIDIYSLGVIMYEMVTGEVPFQGKNYLSIISQVLNEEPHHPSEIRSDISREFEDVILRALAKDPDDRYQSCDELANDLDLLRTDGGQTTMRRRVSASKYRRKRERRSSLTVLGWAAGIAVIVSAVVVTVVMLMTNADTADPETIEPPVTVIAAPAIDAPVTPPMDAAPVAPAIEKVKVHFESTPPGAAVYHGSRQIGTTPFSMDFDRRDARLALTATLAEYDDAAFEINPSADHFELTGKPVVFKLDRSEQDSKATNDKRPTTGTKNKNGSSTRTNGTREGDGKNSDRSDKGTDVVPEGLKKNPFEK